MERSKYKSLLYINNILRFTTITIRKMKLSIITLLSLATLALSKRVYNVDQFKASDEKAINIGKREEVEQPLFEAPKMEGAKQIYIPEGEQPQTGPTLLTSSLNIMKDVSVFASYVRDNVEIATRFNNKKEQSIVFAPTDSAVESLSKKPWAFPEDLDEDKNSEQEVDKITQSNIDDFVESHIIDGTVPFASLKGDKGVQFVSKNGKNIKLVNDNGDYYVTAVVDGKDQEWIKVISTTNADNGAILVIGKPLSVPSE